MIRMLQRLMPLRYWLMLALTVGASLFVHLLFGDPLRLPAVTSIIIFIFAILSRDKAA